MIDNEYYREYYKKHKESILESKRKWNKNNTDKLKQLKNEYKKNNKEKINEYGRKYSKQYSKENPDKVKMSREIYKNSEKGKINQRKGQLKRRFGITLEQYDQIFESQGGVCAICSKPETNRLYGTVKRLSVDHCHKSQRIRGLLCQDCNHAIGFAKDSIEILASAIKYLTKQ